MKIEACYTITCDLCPTTHQQTYPMVSRVIQEGLLQMPPGWHQVDTELWCHCHRVRITVDGKPQAQWGQAPSAHPTEAAEPEAERDA